MRRDMVRFAAVGFLARFANAEPSPVTLFDGKTLDGWIQIENNATSLSSGGITNPAAFAAWLTNGHDAMSVFLRSRLEDAVKSDLANYSPSAANAKTVISALVNDLNQILSGPSIY